MEVSIGEHCSRACRRACELLNIFQSDEIGCDIITVTNDVIDKLRLVGKDLVEYSRETVRMFHRDAAAAAFRIEV